MAKTSKKRVTQTVAIKKEALDDLRRVKSDFDAVVESLELSSDKEFMGSYKKAKQQVAKRDFADWDEL